MNTLRNLLAGLAFVFAFGLAIYSNATLVSPYSEKSVSSSGSGVINCRTITQLPADCDIVGDVDCTYQITENLQTFTMEGFNGTGCNTPLLRPQQ